MRGSGILHCGATCIILGGAGQLLQLVSAELFSHRRKPTSPCCFCCLPTSLQALCRCQGGHCSGGDRPGRHHRRHQRLLTQDPCLLCHHVPRWGLRGLGQHVLPTRLQSTFKPCDRKTDTSTAPCHAVVGRPHIRSQEWKPNSLAHALIKCAGYEHVEALGGSIESIAAAKAGIMKPGRPVVVARQEHAAAQAVLEAAAAKLGCTMLQADKEVGGLFSCVTACNEDITICGSGLFHGRGRGPLTAYLRDWSPLLHVCRSRCHTRAMKCLSPRPPTC